jgi:hypothetical protein
VLYEGLKLLKMPFQSDPCQKLLHATIISQWGMSAREADPFGGTTLVNERIPGEIFKKAGFWAPRNLSMQRFIASVMRAGQERTAYERPIVIRPDC